VDYPAKMPEPHELPTQSQTLIHMQVGGTDIIHGVAMKLLE